MGTQGTSLGKSRNFKLEVKAIQEGNRANSQTKSRNFRKEIKKLQEGNPINLQSNLNPFAREAPLLQDGSILSLARFSGKNRVGKEVEVAPPSVGRQGNFSSLGRNVLVKG